MMLKFPSIIALTLGAFLAAGAVRYDGYKTYRVVPGAKENADVLKRLEDEWNLDFWTAIRRSDRPVDVMVQPERQRDFEIVLTGLGIEHRVLIDDVQKQHELEGTSRHAEEAARGLFNLRKVRTQKEINDYLREFAKSHPEIRLENIGTSYEGNEMLAVNIERDPANPGILIDGGIHAREWAAPGVVFQILQELLDNKNNSHMLQNVNWYLVPIVNPDGVAYSLFEDKMWRKTRSRGATCYGADANRNFDFHWNEDGGSSSECSETYAGARPFSEAETRNLAGYALSRNASVKLYVTFHAYGEYILYPWGYADERPANDEELRTLGERVRDAIEPVYGTRYTVGNSAETLYPAAGASDDWMKAIAGIPLAYTVELPASGSGGFDVTGDDLARICTETWEGVKVLHAHVEDNYARSLSV